MDEVVDAEVVRTARFAAPAPFDHTDAMLRRSVLLLPFLLSMACATSEDPGAVTDTGADAADDDGPTTYRPDDGVDTATSETSTDATASETEGDSGSDAATETATDASSETESDAGSEAATDSGSETATDAASSSPGAARIHEIYSDRSLEGDAKEWVEISAPEGTALDMLTIRAVKADGSIVFDLAVALPGTKMPASGRWVVGGTLAPTNQSYSITKPENWGLPNDAGAVQLIRHDTAFSELVDVVAYGTAPAAPASEPKKVVENVPAALPPAGSTGKSIGRKSVPGDTDDNGADFCVMTASPKAANGACL